MDGNGVDEVGLAGLQCGQARRVFGDLAKDNFFDRRFAAPIIVIAGENQVAAALEADKFIRAGADKILIELIAILVARDLADDEPISQSIQENRQRLLGYKDDSLIVRRLYFSDVIEVRCLQAAALLIAFFRPRTRRLLMSAVRHCET